MNNLNRKSVCIGRAAHGVDSLMIDGCCSVAESSHGSFASIDLQTFPMVVGDTELPDIVVDGYARLVFATKQIQFIIDGCQRMAAS